MAPPLISFVTWKWNAPGFERVFRSHYVNILHAMIKRHYPRPHRMICLTDDPMGLSKDIEHYPLPVTFEGVTGAQTRRMPVCYRRLWNFSPMARDLLGPRILSIDIDVVIVNDLCPVVDRAESFVGWTDPDFGWNKIAGGIYLLETGSHAHVWNEFNPDVSPIEAAEAGCSGSDQGWMSYKMYPPVGTWRPGDGLYNIRILKDRELPADARVMSASGKHKPWSPELVEKHPWIKKHWTL